MSSRLYTLQYGNTDLNWLFSMHFFYLQESNAAEQGLIQATIKSYSSNISPYLFITKKMFTVSVLTVMLGKVLIHIASHMKFIQGWYS